MIDCIDLSIGKNYVSRSLREDQTAEKENSNHEDGYMPEKTLLFHFAHLSSKGLDSRIRGQSSICSENQRGYVLPTSALTEELENADGHGRDVGDQQHAGTQDDQERDDMPIELGQRFVEP